MTTYPSATTATPDNPNLEHINLKIASGETIGIIGGTGSAKSTLVQLIPRLYDVTSGAVKVAGHNVKEYKIQALRHSVSMVLQKNVLFSGTIKENLKWGNADATDAEIEEACRAAAADGFHQRASRRIRYRTRSGRRERIRRAEAKALHSPRADIKAKIIILDIQQARWIPLPMRP
ncbi:MAG: ATP-binding cassette domain-containing protein [Christensenellales bacterium]